MANELPAYLNVPIVVDASGFKSRSVFGSMHNLALFCVKGSVTTHMLCETQSEQFCCGIMTAARTE